MKINWIKINGFRNFVDETIYFAEKTLIIGANDVGKSNLLYALRLLFDRGISERDLELTDSDYNAYSKCTEIQITVEISDVTEDCLKSVFMDAIKDKKTYVRYNNTKTSGYSFWVGGSLDLLQEKQSRFYTKRLNMEYVDTNRDLFAFLKREKAKLLATAKNQLSETATEKDKSTITKVQTGLDKINSQINSLNYIKNSLEAVNNKLTNLSAHNEDQIVQFVAGNSDAQKLLDNLELSYSTADTPLCVGGDGRNNQIFLATWIAKQEIQRAMDHVTFYAIEEPEAHLHPHQQRKLSQYLIDTFEEQLFISSHSPQIASHFTPENIVRLYSQNKISKVAQGGCSNNLKITFKDFGYRLNAISAETFFSDGVLLVEGPSEKIFYTALAKMLDIDLDSLNITILPVDGVGFKPYIKVCQALEIPFVMRTDDDVFSKTVNKRSLRYFGGISRAMGIYSELISIEDDDPIILMWLQNKKFNEWKSNMIAPQVAIDLNNSIRELLVCYNIYLSINNLEEDLADSKLFNNLANFYKTKNRADLVSKMQKRKAENMLAYLQKNMTKLRVLEDDDIVLPLIRIIQLVEEAVHPDDSNE
jgi:putative ATP-dependent endonuclease of OLD family